MNRTPIAAIIGLVLLNTAGCGTLGSGVGGPQPSALSTANPKSGSACLTTSSTGDSRVMVDWVDFVQIHGTQYLAGLDGKVPAIPSSELGSVVGTVQCQLSVLKFQAQPGPAADGDAAFLAIGTDVHAIVGYQPSCRVAARVDGLNRVYLAHALVGGVSKAAKCAKAP